MSLIDPDSTTKAWRALREAWFLLVLREVADTLNETDDEVRARVARNEELKAVYDHQTGAILSGARHLPAAPVNPDEVHRANAHE